MLPLTAMSHISFKGVCGESELPCASHIRHETRASVSVEKKKEKKSQSCVFSLELKDSICFVVVVTQQWKKKDKPEPVRDDDEMCLCCVRRGGGVVGFMFRREE